MTARVAGLWRHPIKSHGREEVSRTRLEAKRTMPWDRVWAVAHEASDADGTRWQPCAQFTRVAKAPQLAAITATLDEARERLTLIHPNLPPLDFDPDREGATFINWVTPLVPSDRAAPARLVRAQGQGMTDSDFASVTLCNLSSHRAVEGRVGMPLCIHRWRGNFWIDGLGPWEEFEWIGRRLRVGEAVLEVRERTDRCHATMANPDTGRRDVDILAALESWGHQDFSVRAMVIDGGRVARGDVVERL